MTVKAPQSGVWDLLRGALATRALGIVAELGIADALGDSRPVTELADTTGADPDTLHRLLRALAGRERSEDQWRTLLEAGGFGPIELKDGLIEARCRSR